MNLHLNQGKNYFKIPLADDVPLNVDEYSKYGNGDGKHMILEFCFRKGQLR